jgi:cation:H+ antiporter
MFAAFTLIVCAALIYVACEYFVNGIEWVGLRLGVAKSAVGTVLAAFGTALPESVVTFAAVATGGTADAKSIGVGAAVGGPLVLSTIAYGVVGLGLLARQRLFPDSGVDVHTQAKLSRDQRWFLLVFALIAFLGLVSFPGKAWFGVVLLGIYAAYTWSEITRDAPGSVPEEEPEPLKFAGTSGEPSLRLIYLQTGGALLVIFAASAMFVRSLEAVSPLLGLSPESCALFFSPVATELPETLNAVIWLRQGKVALAMANISGAMIIQSTVPSAISLFYTPWMFDRALVVAAGVTLAAIGFLSLQLRRHPLKAGRLAALFSLYGVFLVLVIGLGLK